MALIIINGDKGVYFLKATVKVKGNERQRDRRK